MLLLYTFIFIFYCAKLIRFIRGFSQTLLVNEFLKCHLHQRHRFCEVNNVTTYCTTFSSMFDQTGWIIMSCHQLHVILLFSIETRDSNMHNYSLITMTLFLYKLPYPTNSCKMNCIRLFIGTSYDRHWCYCFTQLAHVLNKYSTCVDRNRNSWDLYLSQISHV